MSTVAEVISLHSVRISVFADYIRLVTENPRFEAALPPGVEGDAFRAALPPTDRMGVSDPAAEIRDAVEHGDFRLARDLVARALMSRPDDPDLRRWERVVAPAVVRISTIRGVDRGRDLEWLRAHASEYSGRWVAVDGGALLAEAPSLAEVLDRVRSSHAGKTPLVEWIP